VIHTTTNANGFDVLLAKAVVVQQNVNIVVGVDGTKVMFTTKIGLSVYTARETVIFQYWTKYLTIKGVRDEDKISKCIHK